MPRPTALIRTPTPPTNGDPRPSKPVPCPTAKNPTMISLPSPSSPSQQPQQQAQAQAQPTSPSQSDPQTGPQPRAVLSQPQTGGGTCPGDGRCDGTGGTSACFGCPTYNNAVAVTARLASASEKESPMQQSGQLITPQSV